MSMYKELSYNAEISSIKGIQFCILSAENIVSRSVAEIYKSETYNGNDPVPNGIFDPRMGVIDHNKVCITCQKKNTFCPGHFGHIVLAKPVFHIHFFNIVRNVLKCVCFRCSNLLVDAESEEIKALMAKKGSRQKRFETIFKMSGNIKRCGQCTINGCGAKQPLITKDSMLKLAMEWKDVSQAEVKKQVLNAEDVLRIFRRISDRDSEILGFNKKYNRPEDLICTVLPVSPPSVRPSVRNDTGQRSEDDLTHKMSLLVKANNQLKQKIEKGVKDYIDVFSMSLQYEVATLINNTSPSLPQALQRTGRPIRSLIERLKGKEGRIRGNLMGKRVDFSARSVITPDPNISIDELGVPLKIAMNLTYPEIVNKYNYDELRKYVDNGPDVYLGAKHVRKMAEGRTIRLRNIDRSTIVLEHGDIVDRHLKNGDYVLFNRQPSLHRSSMMAHRVRVMPFNTFRLNVMVTPSFNADFDGDEMNMHVAQSYQTHEELRQLAAVPTQIISPREYKPIVSIVQDIVLGLYRMTKDHVRISHKQMSNIMAVNPKCIGQVEGAAHVKGQEEMWTGHQLLSTIMPRKISMQQGNSHYDSEKKNIEHYVKIQCGKVLSGTFDKGIYQARTVGIIHSICNEYGVEECKTFFDNTQQMICNWLVLNGFSVGISDMVVDQSTMDKFIDIISAMKTEVYKIIGEVHAKKYENKSIKSNHEDFEKKVNDKLNEAVQQVGKEGSSQIDEKTNRLINMIKSGSKGNNINVSQMIGCLGQQNVDGRRIPYGFDDRTLPHYTRYDDGPDARGFVSNSFIKGLTPQEFFFAAMGGREGLIDTAVQSVIWETPLLIMENGAPKHVLIGDWIDQLLNDNADAVVHYANKNMEMFVFESKHSVLIPTSDEDGKMSWGELTAVTRHDPGTQLFKITTESGREVTVADSKSLLIWNVETKKFVETESMDLKIGDQMPVTQYLPPPPSSVMIKNTPLFGDLNRRSGIIVGAFLADGHITSEKHVVFEKDSSSDLDKITDWFFKHGFDAREEEADMHYTLSVESEELVQFFLGGCHVPDMVFAAPAEFVVGVLSGYFAGDKVRIDPVDLSYVARSTSLRLVEGVAMLCSRIGMFAKIAGNVGNGYHTISIRSNIFQKSTQNMQEDVVLDPIKSIETLGVVDHPKLYDVTVPSTLNFGIRSGLICRDTSETGYLQRKLVKAMEDCKVGYDMSVRNAAGAIIQFLYGDDGMDSTKIESQKIPYIEMQQADLEAEYAWPSTVPLSSATAAKMNAHMGQIIQDRTFLITKVFGSLVENTIAYPISLYRTINIAKGLTIGGDPLKPEYVLQTLDKLEAELYVNKHHKGTQILHILLRAYLSPKVVIYRHQLTKQSFDYVVEQIRVKFYDSLAHPLEMVGVLAAQSLGEPSTQLSMVADTKVLVEMRLHSGAPTVYSGSIGSLIDSLMLDNADQVVELEGKEGSTVLDMSEDVEMRIIGVSNDEKTSWRRISQVSRHPANGGVVRIRTKSGKMTCATLSHSFLKRTAERGVEPIKGSDLVVGDRVPVARYIPSIVQGNDLPSLTLEQGLAYGATCSHIMGWVHAASNDFVKGVLSGIFSKGAISQDNIDDCIILLARFGIFGSKKDQDKSEIYVAKEYATKFQEVVGLAAHIDEDADEGTDLVDVVWDPIVEIEVLPDPGEMVYDFTVPGNDSFMVDCGILVHNTLNTFHFSGLSSASKSVRGVPRLKELLSVSKNMKTPNMRITFKDEFKYDKLKCEELMHDICVVRFKDIVIKSQIFFDPNDSYTEDSDFIRQYKEFLASDDDLTAAIKTAPWLIRFEFDKNSMLRYNLDMIMIHHKLLDFYKEDVIVCKFNDDNADQLIFRIKLASNPSSDDDMYTEIKALEHNIMEKIMIKGIEGIEKVNMDKDDVFRYNPITQTFDKMEEWVVYTDGTNFRDMLANDNIDARNVYTNNVNEIYEVLGVEAARQALFNEMQMVLEGVTVNYRHVALLVDMQTNKGSILSVDRHGINRGDIGPLAKCSFEESTDKLIRAGIFAEYDKINGVSANIMLGQMVPAGTGDVQLIMDDDMLVDNIEQEELEEEVDDELCQENAFSFDFSL